MAGQVFKVQRSFREFDPGAMVTTSELAGCDIPFLVRNGSLAPMSAGPVPMFGHEPTKEELLDEVEELTINPFAKLNKQLAEMNTGLFETTSAALKLAQERGEQLLEAVRLNGELVAQVAAAERAKTTAERFEREAQDKLAEHMAQHAKPGGDGGARSAPELPNDGRVSVTSATVNPNARVGTPENPDPTGAQHVSENPGKAETLPPKVPTPAETEKTVRGQTPQNKPGKK